MKITCVLFTLWISLVIGLCNSSVIQMKDGGYTDILVAIHRNVVEDRVILQNLKSLLTNTSAFLYNATRGLAYFRSITIAIPENWTHHSNYDTVFSNQFEQAHIRVDLENDFDGPEPFTRHFRECGEPGEFIQLAPSYLQLLSSPTARNAFGIPERRMVHEWAHFRYGVFDEHPIIGDKKYPNYYMDKGRVVPNTCSPKIGESSYFLTNDEKSCDPREEIDGKCFLRTYGTSLEAKSSLMYSTSFPSITSFCDNSDELRHNPKSITKQNIKCNYKSTWEVISNHQDFRTKRDIVSRPDTTPIFRIVRQSSSAGRCVLVLDISGSMDGTPIQLLHESASRFISDQAPENITIGLVNFGTSATIVEPLTLVNSKSRNYLVGRLPRNANGGGTVIGGGLLTGLQALKGNSDVSVEGSLILLITDGEENNDANPNIESAIPILVKEKVVVHTIAYGNKASDKLSELSKLTGGHGYYFQNIYDAKGGTENLDTAFMTSLTLQSDVAFEPVAITSKKLAMHFDESTFAAKVDDELGRNTVFAITSADIKDITANLTNPSGLVYTSANPEYNKDERLKRIIFRFRDAEIGIWRLHVRKSGNNFINVGFAVTSEPKRSTIQPVRIKTYLSNVIVQQPNVLKVYAMVSKNNLPVIRATVRATIETPKQKTHIIDLRDNGKGADSTKNDGLYTGYFTIFDGKGRYSVTAKVISNKKVRVIRKKRKGRGVGRNRRLATEMPTDVPDVTSEEVEQGYYDFDGDDDVDDPELIEEKIGDFERSANVGVFTLEDWNPQLGDLIPPIRVLDLQVIHTVIRKDGSRIATVQWTSPGDDAEYGNATYIDLRVSTDFDQLLTNFNKSLEVNGSWIVNGTIHPKPSNQIQTVTIHLPVHLFHIVDRNDYQIMNISDSIYLALRAGDESGNFANASNIVTLSFYEEHLSPPHIEEEEVEGIHPGIVILIVVASGAVLLTILMLCLSQRRKRKYRV